MKKSARILCALIMAVVLLSLVFTSCGEADEVISSDETTVEITDEITEVSDTTDADTETEVPPVQETTSVPETTEAPETTASPEETIEAPHEHSWSDWSVTKAATCTDAGTEERQCACGEKEVKTVDALGHTEVIDAALAPTCTSEGKTEGKHCSVCKTVTVEQKTLAAVGHSFGEWKTEKKATCTEEGKSIRSCACGEKESKMIAATGHSFTDGICSSCGKSDPSALDVNKIYNDALELLESGKYEEAYNKFLSIKGKKDVQEYLDRFVWVCQKENYSNASGEYTSVTEYKYDDNGYLKQKRESDSRGTEYITDYFYNSSAGLITETIRRMEGSNYKWTAEYLYNANGDLIEEVIWSPLEEAEYSILYEYDNQGKLVKEINNNFEMSYTAEYSYDNNGKLVQYSATYETGNTTVTKYEYGKNGLLVKETTGYYDGDVVITYDYDDNGNLVKKTRSLGETTEYSEYKLFYRGQNEQGGTLNIITDYNSSWASWSNGEVMSLEKNGKYYIIDKNGNTLAGPFDGVVCPDMEGYSIGYIHSSEVVGTDIDFDGSVCEVVKKTTKSYIIDQSGKIVFESTAARTDHVDESNYEGEYIENFSEGMIVTATYDDYYLGVARNYYTLHIYDIKGNKLADYKDILEHGSFINGKLLAVNSDNEIFAIDRSGKIVTSSGDLAKQHPNFNDAYFEMLYPYVTDGHHTAFFTNGYVIVEVQNYWSSEDYFYILISEDMTKSYLLKKSYVYDNRNYGTLVFSKIVENGTVSNDYYLIDVSKCPLDETGMIIPTRAAAVYGKGFASGNFYNVFGQDEKYALVSTSDGKWGFLSYDGKIMKLYDDASYFSGGIAAVKEGDEFYVIDENFNRISNAIMGYDGVSACGNGFFVLRKDDTRTVAVYTNK